MKRRPRSFGLAASKARGFTLIEVMIAVLVLGIGLLGFALLQTMSVRFAQSANQRTQATNLAYDLLDQMRSNRLLAAQYTLASFGSGATGTNCTRTVGDVGINASISVWQCQVRKALGDGSSAVVTYNAGVARVTLTWGDQRWENDPARRTGVNETGTLAMESRL
ncbi:MAG: type IV pilus modification protein PilV [Pseudoxanthomonas sp.]